MKANERIKRFSITVLLLVGGLILCQLLYRLFDSVMNGFVIDWFDKNYVRYDRHTTAAAGEDFYVPVLLWARIKSLLVRGFVILVILWLLSTRLVSILYASRQEKRVLAAAGQMIGDYMRHDREASQVFPGEYIQISLQMTEIKGAMQRSQQLMREEAGRKNDLITYLAHDLKTPLTSVIGYLSLLEEAPDMPPEQKARYVHIALDKALRLERLTNEFFEITRYNLQQIVLEKETVDLDFMLVQMTDEFYPLLQERGNTLKLETPPEQEMTVYADREKLARVFNNILKNALAYSYPHTEIRVECRRKGENVEIAFSNRGKTIPRQRLDSIFEKFFRLDDARTTNTGGAGLGLAIAKEIVALHGGVIEARSENELTTFTVTLPQALMIS